MSKYTTARRYGEGDRPRKTLAGLIRPARDHNHVLEIQTARGDLAHDPADILNVMAEFYTTLYSTQTDPGTAEILHYLDTISLAWLSSGAREFMDLPITEEDIKMVIGSMPAGKAPGADGLTDAFYKEYADLVAPRLLRVYEEAMETGILPPTLREAVIITLLKPDKDPTLPDSYRPLSLINLDAKIYAKLLANKLQPLLPTIILPDQSGFVPGRSTAHNLRTLFGTLHHLAPHVKAIAAAALQCWMLLKHLTRLNGPSYSHYLSALVSVLSLLNKLNYSILPRLPEFK